MNFHYYSCTGLLYSLVFYCGVIQQGCSPQTQKNKKSISSEPVAAEVKSDTNGVLTAAVSGNSKKTQLLGASENSGIKGSAVEFPPGSLAISTDITIEEGSSLATSNSSEELGITGNALTPASGAVVLTSSAEADAVSPFSLAIPMLSGVSLDLMSSDNIIVVYKVKKYKEGGKIVLGIITKNQLTIEGGKVNFSTQYFGSYQVIVTASPIAEAKQIESTKPIETKAADTTPPTVVLTGVPSSTKKTDSLSIKVSGDDLYAYKYALFLIGITTCVSATYGEEYSITQPLTVALSTFASGTLQLCVIGRDAAQNWVKVQNAQSSSWTHEPASTSTPTPTPEPTPAPTMSPMVILSTSPAANAQNVLVNQKVRVTFSCAVDETTFANRVRFKNLSSKHSNINAMVEKVSDAVYDFSPTGGMLMAKLPVFSAQQNNYTVELDSGIAGTQSSGCTSLVATGISFATEYKGMSSQSSWNFGSGNSIYQHKLVVNSLGDVLYIAYGINSLYTSYQVHGSGSIDQRTLTVGTLPVLPGTPSSYAFDLALNEAGESWISYSDYSNFYIYKRNTTTGNWEQKVMQTLSTATPSGLEIFLKDATNPSVYFLSSMSGSTIYSLSKYTLDVGSTSGSFSAANIVSGSGSPRKMVLASKSHGSDCLQYEENCNFSNFCYYKMICNPSAGGLSQSIYADSPWSSFPFHDHRTIMADDQLKAYSVNTNLVSGSFYNFNLKLATWDLSVASGSMQSSIISGSTVSGSVASAYHYLHLASLANYSAGIWAYPISGSSNYRVNGLSRSAGTWSFASKELSALTYADNFKIAYNNKDEAVAVWPADNSNLSVWFYSGGAWAANIITVGGLTYSLQSLSIAMDDDGVAILAWVEGPDGIGKSYLRRKIISATNTTQGTSTDYTFEGWQTLPEPLSVTQKVPGTSITNIHNYWLDNMSGSATNKVNFDSLK